MIRIKLGELLGKHKMSRKELATLIKARPNTIGDLYNEKARKIDLEMLNRICIALKCDVSDVLEFQEGEEETRYEQRN